MKTLNKDFSSSGKNVSIELVYDNSTFPYLSLNLSDLFTISIKNPLINMYINPESNNKTFVNMQLDNNGFKWNVFH